VVVLECWGTACRAPNGSTPGCAAGLVRRRRGIAARPRHAWVRGRRARTQRCDLTSTRLSEERDTVRGRRARTQRCDLTSTRLSEERDTVRGRRARTQRCDLTSTCLSEERDTVRGRRARTQRCDLTSTRLSEERDTVRGRRARMQRCDLTSTRLSEERDTVRGRRARVQRCDPSREREHHAPDRLAGAAPWQPARTVNKHRRSVHRVLPDLIETRAPDTHVVQSCCTSLLKAGQGGKNRNFYRDQRHALLST
jgi:hypothetical protein